jgi:hypothetical protein
MKGLDPASRLGYSVLITLLLMAWAMLAYSIAVVGS